MTKDTRKRILTAEQRAYQKALRNERLATDPEYRKKCEEEAARARERYHENAEYRKRRQEQTREAAEARRRARGIGPKPVYSSDAERLEASRQRGKMRRAEVSASLGIAYPRPNGRRGRGTKAAPGEGSPGGETEADIDVKIERACAWVRKGLGVMSATVREGVPSMVLVLARARVLGLVDDDGIPYAAKRDRGVGVPAYTWRHG